MSATLTQINHIVITFILKQSISIKSLYNGQYCLGRWRKCTIRRQIGQSSCRFSHCSKHPRQNTCGEQLELAVHVVSMTIPCNGGSWDHCPRQILQWRISSAVSNWRVISETLGVKWIQSDILFKTNIVLIRPTIDEKTSIPGPNQSHLFWPRILDRATGFRSSLKTDMSSMSDVSSWSIK